MIIAVIGGSDAKPEHIRLAESVGQELAKRGVTVVCGGLSGVMEAVCRGVKSSGGNTIGILPGRSPKEANEFIDVPIVTSMGYARNVIVVHTGEAVIAIGGAYGTLSEIGHALSDEIPVVGLNTWSFNREGSEDNSLHLCNTPSQAVETALLLANKRLNKCENG